MGKVRGALTVVFTCTMLVAVMSGPAAALDGERGSGRGHTVNAQFSFRARGMGTGTDATGVFKTWNYAGTWVGEVSCMTVSRSGTLVRATIAGTITSGPSNVGGPFRMIAYDYDDGRAYFAHEFSGDACQPVDFNLDQVLKGRIALTDVA